MDIWSVLGTGVAVGGIQRVVDVYLSTRLRDANAECMSLDQQRETLLRVELP